MGQGLVVSVQQGQGGSAGQGQSAFQAGEVGVHGRAFLSGGRVGAGQGWWALPREGAAGQALLVRSLSPIG